MSTAKVPDLAGAPAWVYSDLFDFEAAPSGPANVAQMYGPLMQSLLEDRFKLKIHRESRQTRVSN
jgi:uncharacterized protein (TIGR03435 family)